MKKAKVMLSAFAVLTVVGAALAFKANTFGTQTFYTTTNLSATSCPNIAVGYKTTTDTQNGVHVLYTTNSAGTGCIDDYITTREN